MEMRYPSHPAKVQRFNTDELREEFLIEKLFIDGLITLVYTHIDRVIIGGAVPLSAPLQLPDNMPELGTTFFLERREMGIVNIGGPGTVTVDGEVFPMQKLDGLYVGRGSEVVQFASDAASASAHFYFMCVPAHTTLPTTHIAISDAEPLELGSISNSNERTIYKFIHPDGVKSCQLTLGVTLLKPNNMWNTMPAHTHSRRSEVYCYFDLEGDNVVFHLMGEPNATRHLVMRNEQAVISPSWSIHAGMGTSSYAFIWAMAGENQTFTDMDTIAMPDLR